MNIINKEIKDKIKQKIDENKNNIKCTEQIKNEVEEEIFELIRQLANEIKIMANKEKDKIIVASAEKKSYSINDDEDIFKTVEKLTTGIR